MYGGSFGSGPPLSQVRFLILTLRHMCIEIQYKRGQSCSILLFLNDSKIQILLCGRPIKIRTPLEKVYAFCIQMYQRQQRQKRQNIKCYGFYHALEFWIE